MNKIIDILKVQKSIPIDKFINVALYDKNSGYYMKKNPFGKNGDYTTSPLVSKLFGEMVAVWCVAFWEHLGKPKKIILAEMGPGDGSLCKDLLKTFKNFADFYQSLEIKLLEKSSKLQKIQKIKIKNNKVKWIKKIDNLNCGPVIFLGNEFFDSLPIKQIYKNNDFFFEKHVALSKNKKKIEFLYKKADKILISNIKKLNLDFKNHTIEYPNLAIKYLELISRKIKKYNGALLTFDYGYTKGKSYNSLQSVKKHKYTNILNRPGNSDITHHINFKLFTKILKKNNLYVKKVTTQSEFLQKLGIIERADMMSKKMNFKEKADMYFRLKKLLHNNEMGTLFKVLLAQKNKKFSLGF